MSLFSTNRCKSLSAEYVEEQVKLQEAADVTEADDVKSVEEAEAPDVTEADDFVNKSEEEFTNEAAYIDALLEALD